MDIAATVIFVGSRGKSSKSALCIENLLCASNMLILVLYFTENVISIHMLVIVHISTY